MSRSHPAGHVHQETQSYRAEVARQADATPADDRPSLLEQSIALSQDRALQTPHIRRAVGFSPCEISAMLNAEVVARHADEAAFLWILRDRAVTAPHYSLSDLAALDERVEAHLDGLRVAGDYGWRLCKEALAWEGPGEVFAATVLALQSGDAGRIQDVVRSGASAPELQRGFISALGWTPLDKVRSTLVDLLTSDAVPRRRVGARGCAVHRYNPGRMLAHLLVDGDPSVRARTLKASGELGRVDLLAALLHCLSDEHDECRFFAAWSSARLGDRSSRTMEVLHDFALRRGQFQQRALTLLLRGLPPSQAQDIVRQLWQHPDTLRLATQGIGAVGDPELVAVLIEMMEIQNVARAAGEAFSMITGIDLAYLDLDQDAPQGSLGGPTEDSEDDEVALDPDEDLPWPNPPAVAAWWKANSERFPSGRRYLCGAEIRPEGLRHTLVHGRQRQRAAAALELGLLRPSEPLFEVRAPGGLQRKRIQTWTL